MFRLIRWFKRLLLGPSLEEAVNATRRVRFQRMRFDIKRIDVLDYLSGSKAALRVWDTYEGKREAPAIDPVQVTKFRDHQRDVLLAGVVSPRLARAPEDGGVFVDDILKIQPLVNFLYTEIMSYSYGLDPNEVKKKAQSLISQKEGSSS